MSEKNIILDEVDPQELWGANNANLDHIKSRFPKLKVISRGNIVKATGDQDELEQFENIFNTILKFVRKYGNISENRFIDFLQLHPAREKENGQGISEEELLKSPADDEILVFGPGGKHIKARTENQKKLVDYSKNNDIVFAIGPAGTGKTYTAVALAVKALKNKQVKRIILTRPAVEAGENLGFLPGDLKEKVDPYLRPLYDALDDMIQAEKLKVFVETRIIEIAPLAFMRGRTLDNCFVILDEAQNATDMQLKMFLTRIGPNAKVIVTGDLTQIDLPVKIKSGLPKALKILDDIKGIKVAYLTVNDVVRHRLVKEIIKAYDNNHESA